MLGVIIQKKRTNIPVSPSLIPNFIKENDDFQNQNHGVVINPSIITLISTNQTNLNQFCQLSG
jgi:hypothetical protein